MCEKIDAPESPETTKALLEFASILHRLCLTEEAYSNPECTEALLKLDAELRKIGQTEQIREILSRGLALRDPLERTADGA